MKKIIKEYSLIIFGSALLALGMNLFLVPSRLSSGGIGALGTIFLYTWGIPLSVTNLSLNALLFGLGYRFLGRASLIKTVAGILSLSVFLQLSSHLSSFTSDKIIGVSCGGALVGAGVGLVVLTGGSTGGSDLSGLIIKKFFPHLSLAGIILAIDCLVIIASAIAFKDYEVAVYSIIAMLISSKITDQLINFGSATKSIYIISQKTEEIEKIIINSFERGVTELYGRGAYTKEEKKMLFCVLTPKEAPRLTKEVKRIDKSAFIIISDAREVLGEGFKIE